MSRQYFTELLTWTTADGTAVTNSTTETIVFSNITIPANYMQDGRNLKMTATGKFSTGTGPPTATWRIRWGGVGGTLLGATAAITTIASVTNALWWIDAVIACRTNGATGTLLCNGMLNMLGAVAPTIGSATGAPATSALTAGGVTAPAAVTVDLTADTALAFTVQWSASSTSHSVIGMQQLLISWN